MQKQLLDKFNRLANNSVVSMLFIFAVVIVSRLNMFGNQFLMDDYDFIVNWPLIQDWGNFGKFFVDYVPPPGQEGIYSPLKTVFHAINYSLFGLEPFGYHVVSLVIHFFGIFFIYKLSYLLSGEKVVAFVCSLLFGLHPVQVEAITYMTASVDMIGIVFGFAAVCYYIKSKEGKDMIDSREYYISIFFALMAVFTHELAISLPILILWHEICYPKRKASTIDQFFIILPYFLIVGCYVLAKYYVLSGITRGNYVFDSFYITMVIIIKALLKYVVICFFPIVLTPNQQIAKGISSFEFGDFDRYEVLSQSLLDVQALFSIFILGVMLYVIVKSWKSQRLISFGIGWFYICLLPVMNIIPSGVLFAERYLYPGLLGFCMLVGIAFKKYIGKDEKFCGVRSSVMSIGLLVLIATFFLCRSWIRNADWRDEISIYQASVKANPSSALMKHDLGLVYERAGRIEESIAIMKEAISQRKDNPVYYFSLANVYQGVGRYKEAIEQFEKAVELDPEFADAYYNLAGINAFLGMSQASEEYLNKAIRIFIVQGRVQEAKEYEKAFRSYFNPEGE